MDRYISAECIKTLKWKYGDVKLNAGNERVKQSGSPN